MNHFLLGIKKSQALSHDFFSAIQTKHPGYCADLVSVGVSEGKRGWALDFFYFRNGYEEVPFLNVTHTKSPAMATCPMGPTLNICCCCCWSPEPRFGGRKPLPPFGQSSTSAVKNGCFPPFVEYSFHSLPFFSRSKTWTFRCLQATMRCLGPKTQWRMNLEQAWSTRTGMSDSTFPGRSLLTSGSPASLRAAKEPSASR